MNLEHYEIRRDAGTWIRRAGQYARDRFGRAVTSHKEDTSLVTDVDHVVQEMLIESILREYPGDAIIAEEITAGAAFPSPTDPAGRCWAIDPIDGTRNYARGVPLFVVSVALLEAGLPVVGFLYNPMTGQLYSAAAGYGAYLGDERISVPAKQLPGGTLIGIPSTSRGPSPAIVHKWLERFVMRNLGTTAMHLAMLANGGFDAVFCDECRLWDIAAGALIAQEAGTEVIFLDDKGRFPIDVSKYSNEMMPFLAGRPDLVRQLLAEYRQQN